MSVFKIISQVRRLAVNNQLLNAYTQRSFLSSKILTDPLPQGADKKKKTAPIPRITLISPDDSIQILTLPEAQKISERRNLKLVKIVDLDTKTQRPVFKLMTGSEYLSSDLKARDSKKADKKNSTIKGEKILLINSRITEHDLDSRIRKIVKWVEKRYEVRVTVNGEEGNMGACDAIYKKMEDELKATSRLVQKRTKGSEMKFQILPPKLTKDQKDELITKTDNDGTKTENGSI